MAKQNPKQNMSLLTPEYHGQPGIEAVQAPYPNLAFAAIVAAAAHEQIGLVHRTLVDAEVSQQDGITDAISRQVTIPIIGTDKDIGLTPLVTKTERHAALDDIFGRIDDELKVEIPVALRHSGSDLAEFNRPRWILLAGRHDKLRYRVFGRRRTIRRVKSYEIIDPVQNTSSIESSSFVRGLIRNSFRPRFTLNAVGVDIIGHEHPDRVEQ